MRIRNRRGAALVEFAIIVSLLLILVFGMIDFGLLLRDYLALSQITREAARIAAVGATPAEIDAKISSSSADLGLDVADAEWTIEADGAPLGVDPETGRNDAPIGSQVSVEMSYTHAMVTGLFGSSRELATTMVFRRE